MKYLLLLCLSGTALWANAQKINAPAVKAAEFYNKTIVQIKPVYKNYVAQTAKAFKIRKPNADSLRNAIKAPGNAMFSNLSNVDIETLVILVMHAAQADAEADIKNMLAQMQNNNKKKEALHDEEQRIKNAAQTAAYTDIKNMTARMEKTQQQKDGLSKEATQINTTQSKTRDSSKTKIPVYNIDQEKRLAKIKDEKDALNEMGTQDMLMLQQAMEKKSQLETMISNMMKAAGETQSGLSNNLKAS